MARAGSVTCRRGGWQEGPEPGSVLGVAQDVLCCPQGMFTQLERPGGSLALSMWHFQRGFSERLFSFSLVWLGRKGKKKIQVTHGM